VANANFVCAAQDFVDDVKQLLHQETSDIMIGILEPPYNSMVVDPCTEAIEPLAELIPDALSDFLDLQVRGVVCDSCNGFFFSRGVIMAWWGRCLLCDCVGVFGGHLGRAARGGGRNGAGQCSRLPVQEV